MKYACSFSQSETEKYFEWIIIFFILSWNLLQSLFQAASMFMFWKLLITIVISVQFNLSTILVVSHFLSAKVSTEWV